MRHLANHAVAAVAVLSIWLPAAGGTKGGTDAGKGELLWQIGKADNDTRELALGPGGYARFSADPLYVVGLSDAAKDWPYAHPGPTDAWGGSRRHTFGIVFGLAAAPKQGTCRLRVDLADTHGQSAPRLRIAVNGRTFDRQMPRGAGDASIFGEPSKGKEHRFEIAFPAGVLEAGMNEVAIITLSGSWVLYDWIGFEAPAGLELTAPSGTLVQSVRSEPTLVEAGGRLRRTIVVDVLHLHKPIDASVVVTGAAPAKVRLETGRNSVQVPAPAVETDTEVAVTVLAAGKSIDTRRLVLKPVRKWVVYLLPHSHVDIGYTQVQTKVERDHWRFYEQAIEASRRTADYPPGARFKWNVEVLWAVDSYLKQADPAKRKAFFDAVRAGWIGLDALYGNELTALCSEEELIRLTDFARRLTERAGVPIDTAMITDVPGYTWGIVGVLARGGVKHFSIGPNSGHRIGYTLSQWGDKPFYWLSPCGKHKVLVWIPRSGYYRSFRSEQHLMSYLRKLEQSGYPYDLVQLRHCMGDNAGPGVDLCEVIKRWNTKHAYPKLKIATTREMFRDFERRYGEKLPTVRGDFTPYWEDGAGSSARETALNRAAAERLVQAEALWAMAGPGGYPDADFYAAWRNVLLYDEHTWGAHNSIREPDSDFAQAQWKIKQAFALDAEAQSRKLLNRALARHTGDAAAGATAATIDVFNTTSWARTDLATTVLPKDLARLDLVVRDARGRPVPSQRLTTGGLAFLAPDVPPFGAARFTVAPGKADGPGAARAEGTTLENGILKVAVDGKTGAIASLTRRGVRGDLVDRSKGLGLNDYLYVDGRDPKSPQRAGAVRIAVKERGPLVASLVIESDAPGCEGLIREVRVISGLGRVDILNTVDRKQVRRPDSVHFAFPFRVPKGVMRMDTPWAVVRPEADQLPGACKNYFTVQRWVDVSSAGGGVTWATLHAPLVEVGAITVDARAVGWIKKLEPSATLYSYAMNNYWETNYKADQPGRAVFAYSIRPHAGYDPAAAQRFGIGRTQPLIAVEADPDRPVAASRLRVEPAGVIATALKPSRDGKAWIVRLFNVSGRPAKARAVWSEPAPGSVQLSDLAEGPGRELAGPVEMAPWEFVTLRAVPAGAGPTLPRGSR